MSVFTNLNQDEATEICASFGLPAPIKLTPIPHGTQNSNYWLSTTQGEYVLTIVEELAEESLTGLCDFIAYLHKNHVPCPLPLANRHHQVWTHVYDKAVLILNKLPGGQIDPPLPHHAQAVGSMLAQLHVLAQNYQGRNISDSRGCVWRNESFMKLKPFLNAHELTLTQPILALDEKIDWAALPTGIIHADLFTDNVLWENDKISGVIDFYFACEGAYIYDLAVALNDWCFTATGHFKEENANALLKGYCENRTLSVQERLSWHGVCSIAALRFWLSRRLALQFPPIGKEVMQKDPEQFLKILKFHGGRSVTLPMP